MCGRLWRGAVPQCACHCVRVRQLLQLSSRRVQEASCIQGTSMLSRTRGWWAVPVRPVCVHACGVPLQHNTLAAWMPVLPHPIRLANLPCCARSFHAAAAWRGCAASWVHPHRVNPERGFTQLEVATFAHDVKPLQSPLLTSGCPPSPPPGSASK